MMKREKVGSNDDGDMAVVDEGSDIFLIPFFIAGLITTEMRPVTACKSLGIFGTRQAAVDAAVSALSSDTQEEGK